MSTHWPLVLGSQDRLIDTKMSTNMITSIKKLRNRTTFMLFQNLEPDSSLNHTAIPLLCIIQPLLPPPVPNHVQRSSSSPVPIAQSKIYPNPNLSARFNPQVPYGGGGGAVVFQGEPVRSTHPYQGVGAGGGARSDVILMAGTTSLPANPRRSFDQADPRIRTAMGPLHR